MFDRIISALESARSILDGAAVRWDVIHYPVRVDPLDRIMRQNPAPSQPDNGRPGLPRTIIIRR